MLVYFVFCVSTLACLDALFVLVSYPGEEEEERKLEEKREGREENVTETVFSVAADFEGDRRTVL